MLVLLALGLVASVGQYAYINWFGQRHAHEHGPWDLLHPVTYEVTYGVVTLLPLLFTPHVVRMFGGLRTRLGKAVALFAASVVAWGLCGNGVSFWYDTCPHWGPLSCAGGQPLADYPSYADVGYLAFAPLAMFALWQVARLLLLSRGAIWEFAAACVLSTLVTGYYAFPSVTVLGFHYGKEQLIYKASNLVVATGVAYLATDILLFAGGLVLLRRSRAAAGGIFLWPVFATGCALFLSWVGDMVYFYRYSKGVYVNADPSDLIYAAGILAGVAAVWLWGVAAARLHSAAAAPVPVSSVTPLGAAPLPDQIHGASAAAG
jgi:hypothetical protein